MMSCIFEYGHNIEHHSHRKRSEIIQKKKLFPAVRLVFKWEAKLNWFLKLNYLYPPLMKYENHYIESLLNTF